MGIWDRIKGFIVPENTSSKLLREYNMDDLIKESRLQFKETITIEDTILERYKKNERVDYQKEILEKHLNTSTDELIKQEQEQQRKNEISEEVEKTLEGEDKETKEKVKEELYEEEQKEDQEGKEKKTDPKERKKELEAKVCKHAYQSMYKEYTEEVMSIKEGMLAAGTIAMTTDAAMKVMAYEKSLEKLEVMYHNRTGKEFSSDKEISKKREEFKQDFELNQRTTDIKIDDRMNEINRLYAQKQRAHEKYLNALYNGDRSPAELAMLKNEYKEATQQLVQVVPSLQEYVKDVQAQQKNEDMARDKHIGNESAIRNEIDVNGKDERLDRNESKVEDKILKAQEMKDSKEKYVSDHVVRDNSDYEYARDKTQEKVTEENLANRGNRDITKIKEDIKIDLEDDRGDFLGSLRSRNQLDTPTEEQLKSDAYYDPEAAEIAAQEERLKEEALRKKDEQMVREIRQKKNTNN